MYFISCNFDTRNLQYSKVQAHISGSHVQDLLILISSKYLKCILHHRFKSMKGWDFPERFFPFFKKQPSSLRLLPPHTRFYKSRSTFPFKHQPLSFPDWPRPPPADLAAGRSPLSSPERWHWPRLPLWQPAHAHHWPLSVCQCRHPPTNQPGPAAPHHHTCTGHNGRPLWAGRCRYVCWKKIWLENALSRAE